MEKRLLKISNLGRNRNYTIACLYSLSPFKGIESLAWSKGSLICIFDRRRNKKPQVHLKKCLYNSTLLAFNSTIPIVNPVCTSLELSKNPFSVKFSQKILINPCNKPCHLIWPKGSHQTEKNSLKNQRKIIKYLFTWQKI